MHEYSIASELVAIILERLKGENVGKVKEVHLRKGELMILSNKALHQAYAIITSGTILEGSQLLIEETKTSIACNSCGYSGKAKYSAGYHFIVPILTCPHCEAPAQIKEGKQLELVKLVVEDKSET